MAIRHLTKSEVSTLVLQLTLAGYVPGRDFKFDNTGQILARKNVFAFLERIPALPQDDSTTESICVN